MAITKERIVEKIAPLLASHDVKQFSVRLRGFYPPDPNDESRYLEEKTEAILILGCDEVETQCLDNIKYLTPEIDKWTFEVSPAYFEQQAKEIPDLDLNLKSVNVKDLLGGMKHDQEKIRLDLLSSIWVNGVGAVLTFGAKKYADHNWRKGIKLSRLLGASLRHTFAFLNGEDVDPETKLSHLYHASCCLMFAAELFETSREAVDDRYKAKEHNQ